MVPSRCRTTQKTRWTLPPPSPQWCPNTFKKWYLPWLPYVTSFGREGGGEDSYDGCSTRICRVKPVWSGNWHNRRDLECFYMCAKEYFYSVMHWGYPFYSCDRVLFIVAMLSFPEVMKKAQEEIDRVIGHDRMPEFHDKDQLPYVLAVINETLRYVFPVRRKTITELGIWKAGIRFRCLVGRRMLVQQTMSIREGAPCALFVGPRGRILKYWKDSYLKGPRSMQTCSTSSSSTVPEKGNVD